jgi:hypothetical protein
MMARSYRRGGLTWPLSWESLVALWILALAWHFLAVGIRWLSHGDDAHFDDWKTLAPVVVVFVMSVWTWFQWVRDKEPE